MIYIGCCYSFITRWKRCCSRSCNRKWKDTSISHTNARIITSTYLIPSPFVIFNEFVKFILLLFIKKRPEEWKKFEVGAIIISPTRELATQISKVLDEFLRNISNLKQILLVGGITIESDLTRLQGGANIIVATPGRLEDILSNHKEINLSNRVKSLVITSFLLFTRQKNMIINLRFFLGSINFR